VLAAGSGSLAYFLPAAMVAFNARATVDIPSPTASQLLFTPSPSESSSPSAALKGAFTVPDDFNRMGHAEIAKLFGTDR